ncbi:hypothetical protein CXB51_021723 [Gossypium anomalum]|uniref:Reverse transcriptase Ty1/copia-type domain-containing protein n=1 Tax=Gossypium anomalum TaxID=47600 RepID=A0A8J5YMY3_9ROSI|nr:hypothetical protein CXB51_021723 [Gossypium anomalum]
MSPMPWSTPFATTTCSPVNTSSLAAPQPQPQPQPQAYIVTPETVEDNAWYPNSGATHHLTHSPTSLAESTPYKGPGKVYVGNGDALSVLSSGKEHKQPLPKSTIEYTALLQLVFADVWGPAPIASSAFRYYVAFTDAYTRQAERVIRHKLKTLKTDGGGEFQALKRYLTQQVYLLNRMPSHPINHASPHEKLFNSTPEYTFLRVFGCLCFPNLRPYNKNKLAFRSTPCTLLGYFPSHKGYRCLDSFGKIYITRHVTFNENVFPFRNTSLKPTGFIPQSKSSSKLLALLPTSTHSPSCAPTSHHSHTTPVTSHNCTPLLPSIFSNLNPPSQHSNPSLSSSSSNQVQHIPDPPPLLPVSCNTHPMVTRSKVGVFKPKAYVTVAPSSLGDVPSTIHTAMSHESWKAAVYSELRALINRTLCSLPTDRRAVGCKWLFKVKTRADGTLDRYKARLVAKGFSQHAGFNYHNTFSLVVRATTIRTVLAISVMKNWPLRQVDVNNAFLNGELAEDIYMEQPLRFEESGPHGEKLVCKLNKALYGLRQASRAWFQTLKQYLVDQLNFRAAKADPSLFIRVNSDNILLLMVFSTQQAVVSRSTSEAEYRSLANCTSELLWVKQLLEEVGVVPCQTPVIWCDNASTVSMAANPTHHAKVKHVEIDHHFVRERVLDGTLQVNYVPSDKQVADTLTKPITPKAFDSLRQALRVLSVASASVLEEQEENQEKKTRRMLE